MLQAFLQEVINTQDAQAGAAGEIAMKIQVPVADAQEFRGSPALLAVPAGLLQENPVLVNTVHQQTAGTGRPNAAATIIWKSISSAKIIQVQTWRGDAALRTMPAAIRTTA